MPRPCSVCTHPERSAIDKALVAGTALRNIAERYGTSATTLHRHKAEHLPATLARAKQRSEEAHASALTEQIQAQEAQEQAHGRDVMVELECCFERVNKLLDACDLWLQDPDEPSRYSLEPRADEISVIYVEKVGRTTLRRKAALSTLLERLAVAGTVIERVEGKHADPRYLLLKTASGLKGQVELLAKLMGQLDERPQVNVLVAPQWLEVREALLTALLPYPEVRVAVAGALLALEAS